MTLTVLPPSPGTARRVRSAPMAPVVFAEGDRTVVLLRGESDISTGPVMSSVLSRVIALHTGDVVIDVAQAEFIDTAAVRVLAVGHRLLEKRGRTLTFRSPSRLAARVLHMFGLTELIEGREVAQP
jgi:anti-anti-sigma factor